MASASDNEAKRRISCTPIPEQLTINTAALGAVHAEHKSFHEEDDSVLQLTKLAFGKSSSSNPSAESVVSLYGREAPRLYPHLIL